MEKLKSIIHFIIAVSLVIIAISAYQIANPKSWSFGEYEIRGNYPTYQKCLEEEAGYHYREYGLKVEKSNCEYRRQ